MVHFTTCNESGTPFPSWIIDASCNHLDLVANCGNDEPWFNDDVENDLLIPLNNPFSTTFTSTNVGVEGNALDAINDAIAMSSQFLSLLTCSLANDHVSLFTS